MTVAELAAAPVPVGRGRWRLVAYQRQFSNALPIIITELPDARGRRLTQKWNTPAELTFTLDGHSPSAALLTELATDIVVTRWDDALGRDTTMFRGLLDHSEDQISEQSATVTFTAHDYFAMLSRRFSTSSFITGYTNMDQDNMVSNLLLFASQYLTSNNGTGFMPGIWLPLTTSLVNPDGTGRGLSGVIRTRNWQPATVYGTAIDDLAKCINGFDYDIKPNGPSATVDSLRIFYPQQGVARTDTALVYGINVSSLTRTVSSADYANYVRVIGNKSTADANAAQYMAETWNTDSNNITVNPVGLWMHTENAPDVSDQATLNEKASGALAYAGLLTPSYTLRLRPGAWRPGLVNMGDAVPLYINEGRLAVNTTVRVVGITYGIGEDGQEDVELTVGRPPATLAKILSGPDKDIDALARR